MLGSGVLDTVIGVVFVFLLVSLLVTTCNELIAAMLRSRAKWLEYGVGRLIGPAWARQLYAHPLIESSTMAWKPAAAGKRPWFGSGPSYIPSRAFANVLLELLHGADNALRQTEAALQKALALASAGAVSVADIKGAVDNMATSLPTLLPAILPARIAAAIRTDLERLSAILGRNDAGWLAGYGVADAAADVQRFIRAIPAGYVRHLIEELEDLKMRKALLVLFDDAGNDIETFKQQVEVWFNNAMDRVAGWYKRRSQWVTAAISLIVVIAMNVDAMLIVRYLDAQPGVRDGLVTQAKAYADARAREPAPPGRDVVAGDAVSGKLTFNAQANDVVLLSTNAQGAVVRPASVTLRKDMTTDASHIDYTLDTAISDRAQKATVTATIVGHEVAKASVDIAPSYPEQLKRIQQQLNGLKLPIGWERNPTQADKDMYLGVPEMGENFWRTVGYHLLGWLITAVAATLGAPFWFDMLNKIMSIRSAGKAPEEMPRLPDVVQAPIGPGQSAKQANDMAALTRSGLR